MAQNACVFTQTRLKQTCVSNSGKSLPECPFYNFPSMFNCLCIIQYAAVLNRDRFALKALDAAIRRRNAPIKEQFVALIFTWWCRNQLFRIFKVPRWEIDIEQSITCMYLNVLER